MTDAASVAAVPAANAATAPVAQPRQPQPHAGAGPFSFTVTSRDPASRARAGTLVTPHGSLQTPAFIFCATKASIKGLTAEQVRTVDTQIILSNTYHLLIQPGPDTVRALGGLHGMTGWGGPMLTDSGGFQIFAMGHGGVADEIKGRGTGKRDTTLLKVTEHGAEFRSYLDGRKIMLTPEGSIEVQRALGADLIVQLDECTPFHVDREYTAKSMRMSHRWGDRCIAEFERHDDGRQALYGIVQGGVYPDLREESASYTAKSRFFGTAVGGSLGGSKAQMREVVDMAMAHVHPDRPVHLLGIGGIDDILDGVLQGIDTFDCVSPTRIARHGWALLPGVPGNRINLRNARYRNDNAPIEEGCPCWTCRNVSRGYIHHLLKAGELQAQQLLSLHNIAVMNRLMTDIRHGIATETLAEVRAKWLVS